MMKLISPTLSGLCCLCLMSGSYICPEEMNVDASSGGGLTAVDIADLVYLVNYMFSDGPEPSSLLFMNFRVRNVYSFAPFFNLELLLTSQ